MYGKSKFRWDGFLNFYHREFKCRYTIISAYWWLKEVLIWNLVLCKWINAGVRMLKLRCYFFSFQYSLFLRTFALIVCAQRCCAGNATVMSRIISRISYDWVVLKINMVSKTAGKNFQAYFTPLDHRWPLFFKSWITYSTYYLQNMLKWKISHHKKLSFL